MTWEPGINHIEFWVRSAADSLPFYRQLFAILGWNEMGPSAFSTGRLEIYFKQAPELQVTSSLGPRHLCLQAMSAAQVDEVARLVEESGLTCIRGPVKVDAYSPDYYTVDFRDPDGYILEVAHTPNMKL
jgi:catechol 2,3-dioxygenase-like lactoylglutathione lyase family enzyme